MSVSVFMYVYSFEHIYIRLSNRVRISTPIIYSFSYHFLSSHCSSTVAKLQLKRKRKDPAVTENADVSVAFLICIMIAFYCRI